MTQAAEMEKAVRRTPEQIVERTRRFAGHVRSGGSFSSPDAADLLEEVADALAACLAPSLSLSERREEIARAICKTTDDSGYQGNDYPRCPAESGCACWGAADAVLALPAPERRAGVIEECARVADAFAHVEMCADDTMAGHSRAQPFVKTAAAIRALLAEQETKP